MFGRPVDWTAQWLLSNWSKMFEAVCRCCWFYVYIFASIQPIIILYDSRHQCYVYCRWYFVEKRRKNFVLIIYATELMYIMCCVSRIKSVWRENIVSLSETLIVTYLNNSGRNILYGSREHVESQLAKCIVAKWFLKVYDMYDGYSISLQQCSEVSIHLLMDIKGTYLSRV